MQSSPKLENTPPIARQTPLRGAFVDLVPVQLWTARPNGALEWVSERSCRETGVAEAELMARGWFAFFHPDDQRRARERWGLAVTNAVDFEVEARISDGAGGFVAYLVRAVPERDARGAVARWCGVNTRLGDAPDGASSGDRRTLSGVEARRAASTWPPPPEPVSGTVLTAPRSATFRMHEQLVAALGAAPAPVCLLEGPGHVVRFANAAYLRLTGRPMSEVIDAPAGVPFVGVDALAYQHLLDDVLAVGERRLQLEVCVGTRPDENGQPIELLADLAHEPVFDATGRAVGMLVLASDVTDAVLARRRANQAMVHLEKLFRQREDSLAYAATEAGARADWSMILCDRLRAAVAASSSTASSSTALYELIDALMAGAGSDAPRELASEPFDLASVIDDAIDDVRAAAQARDVGITAGIDPTCGQFVGDPRRMHEVVWILANHAIASTPSTGRVALQLGRAGNQIELRVKANATGIVERDAGKGGASSPAASSDAWQLPLARHLVEAHHGTTRADVALGGGAARVVSFPVKATRHLDTLSLDEASLTALEDAALHGLPILVVDDDADVLDLVASVLTSRGAVVETAGSAEEALRALDVRRPALLIADIGMPEIDGTELIRRVRRKYAPEELPAIALTANAQDSVRRAVLESGFQRFLVKPANPATLLLFASELAIRSDPELSD